MSEASTPILPMDLALAAESMAPGMASRKLIGMLATSRPETSSRSRGPAPHLRPEIFRAVI